MFRFIKKNPIDPWNVLCLGYNKRWELPCLAGFEHFGPHGHHSNSSCWSPTSGRQWMVNSLVFCPQVTPKHGRFSRNPDELHGLHHELDLFWDPKLTKYFRRKIHFPLWITASNKTARYRRQQNQVVATKSTWKISCFDDYKKSHPPYFSTALNRPEHV